MSNTINFADDAVEDINNMSFPPENSEAVEKNRAWIKKAYEEQFEVVNIDDNDEKNAKAWRRYNADVLDRIKFVDDDGLENKEVRANCEETIWEIAKNEVLRERAFDFSFMKLKEADRLKLLRADLSDSVAKTALGVVGISPVIKNEIDGEIAAEELAKVDAKLSIKALDKFLSDKGKEKAEVSKDAVIGVALHESEAMERHIDYIEKAGYSKNVVDGFKKDHKDFGQKMKNFFGKAWTSAKEYVANNRLRVVVDTAATAGMMYAFSEAGGLALGTLAGLSTAGVGYVAVGAYAAYAAIGSAVWPIIEKRRKTIRQAKREGRSYDDYKLGMTLNGLRKAWKDIRSDEKEWKRYKNRAKTGAAAGVVMGGILGAAGTHLVTGVDALASKIIGTITRSAASVTSQYMNVRDTKKDLKENDTAENRADYKSAKTGMWIGGTIAALGAAWGAFNLFSSQPEVSVDDEQAQNAAQKVVKKTTKVARKVVENVPAAEAEIPYPPVWSAESGISQKHFEEIYGKFDSKGNWNCGKITGILSRQNKAFDEWNASHPDDLRQIEVKEPKAMYQSMMENLHKARAADPALFAGKTDDQVLYQYIKNVEYSERAKTGPIVNGIRTLITITDKDGMPTYASNQAEMQALFKILRCGEKGEVSAEAINATLDRIDLKTGVGIGKEFTVGQTGNSFWGYGEDCKNGVSMWKKGWNAVKKVFVKTTQMRPLEPVEPEIKSVQPIDADVKSVQMRPLEQVDADVKSTNVKEGIILGRGTSHLHDNDLTDEVAQKGKKIGATVFIKNENGGR